MLILCPILPRSKKKLWVESQRWGHDRYDDKQQAPKSREEIIAMYGYDIRAHEKPPDAPLRGNKGYRYWPERLGLSIGRNGVNSGIGIVHV